MTALILVRSCSLYRKNERYECASSKWATGIRALSFALSFCISNIWSKDNILSLTALYTGPQLNTTERRSKVIYTAVLVFLTFKIKYVSSSTTSYLMKQMRAVFATLLGLTFSITTNGKVINWETAVAVLLIVMR